ncbi:MAG: VacJ family lipoprotein [Tropicimonas sp.]|uniref:MlaA family lipoprotein n=1 Tax=Tropicimonas sp. TaxID=2067044 RepID=UPI003A8A76C7
MGHSPTDGWRSGRPCRRLLVAGVIALSGLAACGPASIPAGINDPGETANRRVHDFNKRLDSALGGGKAASATDEATDSPPAEVSPLIVIIDNFGTNLDTPRKVVNSLLQLRPGDASRNTLRFGINSTIGVLGLFDVARAAGLPEVDTDFGETLHVWGVPEGRYQELPVIGPSTARDTAGRAVDFVMNPLWHVLPWPENLAANGATWASTATDRIRYGETVDSILHGSADSYAQSRLIYLQNRRFELGRGAQAENDESLDLFEEYYGD